MPHETLEVVSRIYIKEVLAGDVSHLINAFVWGEVGPSHDFWCEQYENNRLSPEGRAILEGMIGVKSDTTKTEEEKPVMNLCLAIVVYDALNETVTFQPMPEKVAEFKPDPYVDSPTVDGIRARFRISGEYYSKPSSFRMLSEGGDYVIWDLDKQEPFGRLAEWAKAFGFKNLSQLAHFVKVKSGKGDLLCYNALEALSDPLHDCFRVNFEGVGGETFNEVLSGVYYFAPIVSEKGISFYASYRDSLRDRRSETTYGRFARKIFPKATDAEVEKFSDMLAKKFIKRKFILKEGKKRKDFAHAYGGRRTETLNLVTYSGRKSLANSCMRDNDWGFDAHPAEVYASGDFTIFWLETPEKGLIGGRVVVYFPKDRDPQAGPCYGVCEHSLDLLEQKLKEIGAVSYGHGSDWWGAKLLKVEVDDGFLMPYLDLSAEGREEDGHFILDRKGDLEFCSTEGIIFSTPRCRCYHCDERVDEDYSYHNEDGETFCEDCYHRLYGICEVTQSEYPADDLISDVHTNSRRFLWGNMAHANITVGPDVSVEECYYTDELWLLDDMEEDVDGNYVSPIYARNNLTRVGDSLYSEEQLAKHGLDEDGNEIAEQEGEAA
jgi:hypothetical protein